ncbi:MAG: hypothetical protein AAB906_00005, partial [Patescibacteria group bacterium]
MAGGFGGQIPYQSSAGVTAMLANGTAGQVLQSNGTTLAPSWTSASAGDMTLAGIQTVTGAKTFNSGKLILAGATSGTTILNATAVAGAGTVTIPTSGTLYGTETGSITSLQLATSLTDETGSGAAVFATSPTLVTPVLGAATATSINGLTISSSTGSLTILNTKTLSVADNITFYTNAIGFQGGELVTFSPTNALSLLTTAATSVTFPTSGTLYGTATGSITSSQLATSLTDETGTGLAVFSAGPTMSGTVSMSGTLVMSAYNTPVSNALISVVSAGGGANGNGLEFGHNNAAGYRGTLGAETSSGKNFLAFHSEAGTT